MQERFTFGKNERLTHRKVIDTLFQQGKSYKQFPVLMIVMEHPYPGEESIETVVVASKRIFKRAVDRNRVKRVLREAWRLQKNPLREEAKRQNIRLAVALVYVGKALPEFHEVNSKICALSQRLIEDIPNFPTQASNPEE